MNYTRILGQNNKIYQKFGDYCITEALPNQCCIVCCFCQEEHHAEDTFWAHVQEMHEYKPPQLLPMQLKPLHSCLTNGYDSPTTTTAPVAAATPPSDDNVAVHLFNGQQQLVSPTVTPTPTSLPKSESPMYVEAEYLEGVDLNDPNTLLELDDMASTFFGFAEQVTHEQQPTVAPEKQCVVDDGSGTPNCNDGQVVYHNGGSTPQSIRINDLLKTQIDIDKLVPKQLCVNGKLLKRLFQQLQRTNNEFKYKLNKLTQAVKIMEEEQKKQPTRVRKRYMKIIPDQPFNTRDEVLILDDELHHSKEMRDALHDEAMAIVAENADVYCRVLWRFIMTNEVSNQFCWRGVVDGDKVIKYPVKDMTMMDVFQGVFREKFPAQALNYFKERTMTYFNKAHERLKRKQLSKVESAESNSCDFLCDNDENEKQMPMFNSNNTNTITTTNNNKRTRQTTERMKSIDTVIEEVFC